MPAAVEAQITIRDIDGAAEIRAVEDLQKEVWGIPDLDVVPLTHLVAAQQAGGVLLGAEANRNLDEMVRSMKEIDTSSEKISKIIKVIDEIAFQTNILALNAAVEAARAGEAGMGFAVVADEVRSLAQRSAQAAKDTASLIEDSIGKSREGSQKMEQVASSIRQITANSSQVKTLVDAVDSGSQEQARGIEQIGSAIAQIEQVTQRNAASAEESAAAAEELSSQAETVQGIVDRLRVIVGGEAGGNRSTAMKKPARTVASATAGLAALRKTLGASAAPAAVAEKALAGRAAFPLDENEER
jgi:methyl-accepting chemotaxis protein/methyl-accepting chemotaxis protein-1 (serine sensor receptor)